jgi:hypothetical protein
MSILMLFCQNSGRRVPCRTPPLPLGFTAITDHLRAGEVPPASGLQYSAATVKNSSQFPVAGHVECRGCSPFLTGQQALHRSGEFPETNSLYT